MRILLIEDSERMSSLVSDALRRLGYTVLVAPTAHAASGAVEKQHFDVAVVDIGLPDGSGLDFCKAERQRGSDLPILMLTARTDVSDRVAGLDAGADDYVGKPFAMDELVARVRALVRRGPRFSESTRTYGNLHIDRARRTVEIDGRRAPLTSRELDIVALLAWCDGRVVSKDELVESVWGDATESALLSFDVLLTRIRRKLAERGVADAIRTVRQVGYAWALDPSKPG